MILAHLNKLPVPGKGFDTGRKGFDLAISGEIK